MYSKDNKVKIIQQAGVSSLKLLDEICKERKLTYYVCGGTLIGTIREHGFIPWDDDIDIMMPRKDYEWLLDHGRELFQDPFYLVDYRMESDRDIIKAHAVLYNKNVYILDQNSNKEKRQFSYIDIFPLDGMPRGSIKQNLHYYHAFLWRIILQLSWYDNIVNQHKEGRNGIEKIAINIMNNVKYRPKWDSIKILGKWHRIMSKYEFDKSDTVCSLTGPRRKKEILRKEYFNEILRMPFESIEVNVPGGYDEELKHYYGNYMMPPNTKEETVLHHRMTFIGGK